MSKVDKKLGQIVRRYRKDVGLGQVQLSRYLGLDQSALSRVENGKQPLTAPQLFRVFKRCKVNDHEVAQMAREMGVCSW